MSPKVKWPRCWIPRGAVTSRKKKKKTKRGSLNDEAIDFRSRVSCVESVGCDAAYPVRFSSFP
jgi:hypothetical protein